MSEFSTFLDSVTQTTIYQWAEKNPQVVFSGIGTAVFMVLIKKFWKALKYIILEVYRKIRHRNKKNPSTLTNKEFQPPNPFSKSLMSTKLNRSDEWPDNPYGDSDSALKKIETKNKKTPNYQTKKDYANDDLSTEAERTALFNSQGSLPRGSYDQIAEDFMERCRSLLDSNEKSRDIDNIRKLIRRVVQFRPWLQENEIYLSQKMAKRTNLIIANVYRRAAEIDYFGGQKNLLKKMEEFIKRAEK